MRNSVETFIIFFKMVFGACSIVMIALIKPMPALALYNGNPSFPMMPEESLFFSREQWFGIKAGYEFDGVYDRRLKVTHRQNKQRKRVQKYDSVSSQGVLTFNFNDRVEIFGAAGAMSFNLSQHPFRKTKVSYKTQTHCAWGVGGRTILAYWGDLQVAVNAGYLYSNLPLSSVKVNSKSYPKKGATAQFREWQIGAGASYRFRWFIPYLGLDYSDFRTNIVSLKSLKFLFKTNHAVFKEVYPFGLFFGFGLSPDKGFNVNFEARVINENAVSASFDIKF